MKMRGLLRVLFALGMLLTFAFTSFGVILQIG
jgi:hypothetical protein